MVTYDNNFTNTFKGILAIVLYFVVTVFRNLPLAILHIDYNSTSMLFKELYVGSIEVLLIIAIFFIFKDQFKKAFKDLKKNHLKYFKNNFKFYILGVAIMMLCNALLLILGGPLSNNEVAVRNQLEATPIYMFISSVLLAPILEESVFRLGFRNLLQNNFLFILFSSLVFGSLHLSGMFNNHLFFLYLMSYCSCAIAFAYMMIKTNNIFVSMGFHFMHNGILVSLQIFMMLFG